MATAVQRSPPSSPEIRERMGRLPFSPRAPGEELARTMQVPVLNLRKGQTAGLGDDSTSFDRGEVRRALVETSRKPEEELSKDRETLAVLREGLLKDRETLPKDRLTLPKDRLTLPKDRLTLPVSREVLPEHRWWAIVPAASSVMFTHTVVTLLVHKIKHVNAEIRVPQYFFGDIVNEGVLLYDAGRFMLARPKALNAEERLKLAIDRLGEERVEEVILSSSSDALSAWLIQTRSSDPNPCRSNFVGAEPNPFDNWLWSGRSAPKYRLTARTLPRKWSTNSRT